MAQVLTLARWRLRLLRRAGGSGGRGGGNRVMIRIAVLGLLGIFAAVSLANLLSRVISGPLGRLLLAPLLTWASTWGTLMLFLFGILTMLGALTYASDLRLLLLTPLSPRLLLAEKFGTVYGTLTLPMLVIGFIVLFGVGNALGLGVGYDVTALLGLLLLPIVPLALGMLLIVAILRWVPPARARNLVAILGAFFGIAAYLGVQVFARGAARSNVAGLQATFLHSGDTWWSNLPSAWPGRAVAAAGQGQTATVLGYLGLTVLLDAVLAGVAIALTARLFATGWATYQEVGRRSRGTAPTPSMAAPTARGLPVAAPMPSVAPTTASVAPMRGGAGGLAWWPLLVKEWRSLRRDPQIWARLLYPLVILGFGFYRTITQSTGEGAGGATAITFYASLTFMVYFLMSVFALPLINREGRALYLLALTPLSAAQVLYAKWSFAAVPALVLVEILLVIGAVLLRLSVAATLLAALSYAVLIVALAGAMLLISLVWPRLDWDNPRRQTSGTASLVGAACGLILAGATCFLLVLTFIWSESNAAGAWASGAGIFVLTGLVIAVAAALAPRRLDALLHRN